MCANSWSRITSNCFAVKPFIAATGIKMIGFKKPIVNGVTIVLDIFIWMFLAMSILIFALFINSCQSFDIGNNSFCLIFFKLLN